GLDLLLSHITSNGELRSCSARELGQAYRHCKDLLPGLIRRCKDLYLLMDHYPRGATEAHTRLTHRFLSPVIWSVYSSSIRPAQRARRIIEYRSAGGTTQGVPERALILLNRQELKFVEQGRSSMRAWNDAEQKLVASSQKKRRNWRLFSTCLILLTLGALVFASYESWRRAKEKAEQEKFTSALFKLVAVKDDEQSQQL